MNEERFEQAVRLSHSLGETRIGPRALFDELRLGQEMSLWQVVAPYLALYRFPLLFSNGGGSPWRERLRYAVRPYRGLAARFRDSVISPPRRTAAACKQWPEEGRTILFLGFVPTFYRDVLRPVAEALAARESMRAVVIGEGRNIPPGIPDNGSVRFQSLWDHWDTAVDASARLMTSRLRIFQKSFFHNGWDKLMKNSVGTGDAFGLASEFRWLFRREFRRLIPQAAVAEHILQRHRPSLIVSADDADQRCRVYSLLAREKGIPSLLVQQGLTEKKYPEWKFFSQTAVAAMGSRSRDDMIAQGVPPERIALTGHPGFDSLARPEPDLRARMRADMELPQGRTMVLLISQPYYVGVFNTPRIRREMLRGIIRACGSLEDVVLAVKPHPGEDAREIKELIGTASNVVMVDRTIDIVPLVKACDVVITFFSTVALQALYAGRPVVNVAFPGSGGQTLYEESGATWVARSTNEIIAHIRTLTGKNTDQAIASREEARGRFLREMVYLPDGRATERVVRLALDMLGG